MSGVVRLHPIHLHGFDSNSFIFTQFIACCLTGSKNIENNLVSQSHLDMLGLKSGVFRKKARNWVNLLGLMGRTESKFDCHFSRPSIEVARREMNHRISHME